jgi:uncharacterized membrane protein
MLSTLFNIDLTNIPEALKQQFSADTIQQLIDDAIKQRQAASASPTSTTTHTFSPSDPSGSDSLLPKDDFILYQPRSLMEAIEAFTAAVRWKEETFLFYLTFFYLSFLFLVITLRRSVPALFIILIVCLGAVLCAHPLNTYANMHWQSFATQNYFDKSGFFIVIMYAVPLVTIALIALIFILIQTSQLLVRVKQLELKTKRQHSTKKIEHKTVEKVEKAE